MHTLTGSSVNQHKLNSTDDDVCDTLKKLFYIHYGCMLETQRISIIGIKMRKMTEFAQKLYSPYNKSM